MNTEKKIVFITILVGLVIGIHSLSAFGGLDYTHITANDIVCNSCHQLDGNTGRPIHLPAWAGQYSSGNIEDTPRNILCRYCHNDTDATSVKTHSSMRTSNKYGEWMVECYTCHNPHFQKQFYGASTLISFMFPLLLKLYSIILSLEASSFTDG